jgi:hypothetical protein
MFKKFQIVEHFGFWIFRLGYTTNKVLYKYYTSIPKYKKTPKSETLVGSQAFLVRDTQSVIS